jgi:uncharacterized protein (DUF952 family)
LPARAAAVRFAPTSNQSGAAVATIYKICPATLWQAAVQSGVFDGSPADRADGYIHFSTAAQVASTLAKHYPGVEGLLLAAFDEAKLAPPIRYEPARGGMLFPHLYGTLNPADALWVKPLGLGTDGRHLLPDLEP